MRRSDLITAVSRVVGDLTNHNVESVVDMAIHSSRTERSERTSWFDIGVIHRYLTATSGYGDAENAVMKMMSISDVATSAFWQKIISAEMEADTMYGLSSNIGVAVRYLPKFASLLTRESDEVGLGDFPVNDFLSGKDKFTFILPEATGYYSSPSRAAYLLEGVTFVYEVLSELRGVEGKDLAFLSCDSGSDKVFDFAGSGEIVREFKELFIGMWDRVVFYKQHSQQVSVSSVATTLPVIEKISQMEQNGSLGKEAAEILRRKLLKGVDKVFDSGALTPEMEDRRYDQARVVIQAQPKLLAGPTSSEARPLETETDKNHSPFMEGEVASGSDGLSVSEIATLRELLTRASASSIPTLSAAEPATPASNRKASNSLRTKPRTKRT